MCELGEELGGDLALARTRRGDLAPDPCGVPAQCASDGVCVPVRAIFGVRAAWRCGRAQIRKVCELRIYIVHGSNLRGMPNCLMPMRWL